MRWRACPRPGITWVCPSRASVGPPTCLTRATMRFPHSCANSKGAYGIRTRLLIGGFSVRGRHRGRHHPCSGGRVHVATHGRPVQPLGHFVLSGCSSSVSEEAGTRHVCGRPPSFGLVSKTIVLSAWPRYKAHVGIELPRVFEWRRATSACQGEKPNNSKDPSEAKRAGALPSSSADRASRLRAYCGRQGPAARWRSRSSC